MARLEKKQLRLPEGDEWDNLPQSKEEARAKGLNRYMKDGELWELRRSNTDSYPQGKPERSSARKQNRSGTITPDARNVDLKNTTLDPLGTKNFKNTTFNPQGGPLHHAVAVRLLGKMHRQFELNINPNWTPDIGPSVEGKSFIRNLQNRLGIFGGDSPVNWRSYPPDNPNAKNPKVKGVSKIHDKAHDLAKELGIEPQLIDFKNYSNDDLYQYASNKLAPAVQKIDKELGFLPEVKTAGEAGKHLRIKQILASKNKVNKLNGISDILNNPPENYEVDYVARNGNGSNGNGSNGNGHNGNGHNGNGVNKNGNGIAVNGKNGKNGFLKGLENVTDYSGVTKFGRSADQLINIGVNASTGNYGGAAIGAATFATSKALQDPKVQARVAKQITQLVAERSAKSAAKFIPGLDVVLSGKESWDYLKRGRWDQAGIAALSGAIGWIPLIGDGASAALDLSNTGIDIARLQAPTGSNKKKSQNKLQRFFKGLNT